MSDLVCSLCIPNRIDTIFLKCYYPPDAKFYYLVTFYNTMHKFHKTNLKHLSYAVLLSSGIILSSCGKKAPKCSDKEVLTLVQNMIYEQMYNIVAEKFFPSWQRSSYSPEELEVQMKQLKQGLHKQFPVLDPAKTDYIVDTIITAGFDKETGSYTCKSTFKTIEKATKKTTSEASLVYRTEATDDGKSFQVTIEN